MNKKELIKLLEEVKDDEEIYVVVPDWEYLGNVIVKPIININYIDVRYYDYIKSFVLGNKKDSNYKSENDKIVLALKT